MVFKDFEILRRSRIPKKKYINKAITERTEFRKINDLKVVSTTFLLVCFVCLKESTFEIRKNVFYFTL